MARISWTEQAIEDLRAICEFIARDAPRYAQVFADRAFETVDRLRDFPKFGRIVPGTEIETLREVILGNYRIVRLQTYDRRSGNLDRFSRLQTLGFYQVLIAA